MKNLLICMVFLGLIGCVKTPTQNTQVVDDRPGLTFQLNDDSASAYELKVDGVSYGSVGQYLSGQNRLRLVDGTHRVELVNNGEVVFSQKVYLGAGVNRVIKVGIDD